jgi:hypothetical protein
MRGDSKEGNEANSQEMANSQINRNGKQGE